MRLWKFGSRSFMVAVDDVVIVVIFGDGAIKTQ
jgi:hypothetical protein